MASNISLQATTVQRSCSLPTYKAAASESLKYYKGIANVRDSCDVAVVPGQHGSRIEVQRNNGKVEPRPKRYSTRRAKKNSLVERVLAKTPMNAMWTSRDAKRPGCQVSQKTVVQR